MSNPTLFSTERDAVRTNHTLRDVLITVIAVIGALVALYAVFLDQGQLLSPMLGKLSYAGNYVHEFTHDGRHLLGAPCH